MVDRQKLDQILRNLNEYVGYLRDLAEVEQGAFLADRETVGSAKYHFVIAIECCLDAANHIIASERFRAPKSTADALTVLVEEGILPPEMQKNYEDMAKFRNRLVHRYWEVDNEMLYQFLQERLGDFDEFGKAVARLE